MVEFDPEEVPTLAVLAQLCMTFSLAMWGRTPKAIRFDFGGDLEPFNLPINPAVLSLPPPVKPSKKLEDKSREVLSPCKRDVLAVIEEASRRLTTGEILSALQEMVDREGMGHLHGDSTVAHALAEMVRADKLLTNKTDSHGKGYGLPAWS